MLAVKFDETELCRRHRVKTFAFAEERKLTQKELQELTTLIINLICLQPSSGDEPAVKRAKSFAFASATLINRLKRKTNAHERQICVSINFSSRFPP
jgi:hypothetical protein